MEQQRENQVTKTFGNRLRVRVCGILIEDNRILMVRHKMDNQQYFWSPPGGGLDYGETTHHAIAREFQEETGLEISITQYLFTHEFLNKPLHGIELFFEVRKISGELIQGTDPEMAPDQQIIDQIALLSIEEIKAIPSQQVHHIFSQCQTLEELRQMNGLYQFIP